MALGMGRTGRGSGDDGRERADLALLRLRTGHRAPDLGELVELDSATADAVALAMRCGAALDPVVAAASDAARQRARLAGELEAAVAPARTVARTLVALPLVSVPVIAVVTGIDLVDFYLRDPVGRVLLVVVGLLLGIAIAWMRVVLSQAGPSSRPDGGSDAAPASGRWAWIAVPAAWFAVGPVPALAVAVVLVVRSRRGRPVPTRHLALAADLVAVAASSGHDLSTALRLAGDQLDARGGVGRPTVATALRELGLHLALRPGVTARVATDGATGRAAPDGLEERLGPLAPTILELAHTGAPGTDLLRDLARRLRAEDAQLARAAVARLPARLTFPTALVLVPATVLAIGAPIVLQGLAVLTST